MYTSNLDTLTQELGQPPAIYNYLRPNAFKFTIKDLPKVAYTCQSANLPSVQLGFATQPTPFVDIPRIGDKLVYSDFAIRFLISEDMSNYIELFEWLVALGFPNSYDEYPNFTGTRLNRFPFYKNARGDTDAVAYSDGILTILESNNIPKTQIIFKDLFPVSVEALDFDVTSSTVDYFIGVAGFKYRTFEILAL